MLQHLQGFWKALSAHDDDALRVFSELLVLCDEFSVTLDYSTPTSGGEWVVMVAHFGDRTTFRFPRLNFDARDAYNQLLQRLDKAKKKAMPVKAEPVISEDPATTGKSEPLSSGVPASQPDNSVSKDAPLVGEATEGKSSSASTPEATGESSKQPQESTATDSTGKESEKSLPALSEPKSKPDNKTRRQ